MIVVVTGGRDYADARRVHAELARLNAEHGLVAVAHGDCPTGADAHAAAWAGPYDDGGIEHWRFPAAWEALGRRAGPVRNGRMLRYVRGVRGEPCMVLAFPGGAGTADCVRQARALGLRVEEVGG